jgi:hypothetical protein
LPGLRLFARGSRHESCHPLPRRGGRKNDTSYAIPKLVHSRMFVLVNDDLPGG